MAGHKWESQHSLKDNWLIRKGYQGLTIKTVGFHLAFYAWNEGFVVFEPKFYSVRCWRQLSVGHTRVGFRPSWEGDPFMKLMSALSATLPFSRFHQIFFTDTAEKPTPIFWIAGARHTMIHP